MVTSMSRPILGAPLATTAGPARHLQRPLRRPVVEVAAEEEVARIVKFEAPPRTWGVCRCRNKFGCTIDKSNETPLLDPYELLAVTTIDFLPSQRHQEPVRGIVLLPVRRARVRVARNVLRLRFERWLRTISTLRKQPQCHHVPRAVPRDPPPP